MAQISVNNLTFAYEGSFDNVFENVSFSVDTNWRLGFIGRNTLIYYIWANYSMSVYRAVASRFHLTISNAYLSACMETLFVCCVCAVLAVICNRFFPEAVGKKRRCKQ